MPTLLTPGTYISAESFVRSYNFNRLPADAKLFTPAAAKPPVTVISPPPPASGVEQYLVTNLSTGVSEWEDGQAYDGPVAARRHQFLAVPVDNVIRTGSGDDGIDISHLAVGGGGTNVVDGGAGSSFVLLYDPGYGKGADTVLISGSHDPVWTAGDR